MVKVDINGRSIYYDGYLLNNLQTAKEVIQKDWDMVFIIDGIEGSGKSVLAQQIAFFLDSTLTIDRVVFTPQEFTDAIVKAGKYQAIIYDEAYRGLSSRQAMSQVNKALVSMMAEIRQKNLYIFIVIPCFFELDKYMALWRSRALLHVYTGEKFKRGFFSFFSIEKKKRLYIKGKKLYEYLESPNFRGRFVKGYCVDEEQYRARKLEVLRIAETKKDKREQNWINQRNILIIELTHFISQQEIADCIRLDKRTISDIIIEDRETKEEQRLKRQNFEI